MIWTNLTQLEDKIVTNNLSEQEGVVYFIASIIYATFASYVSLLQGATNYAILMVIVGGITVTLTAYYSYHIHKQQNTADFLQNYFAITWVIRIRLLVVSVAYLLIYISIFSFATPHSLALFLNLLFQLSIDIAYFYLTVKSFTRIASQR